jgi:hypothetical protein
MQVLILAKSGPESEASSASESPNQAPDPEAFAAYSRFSKELVDAGVVLAEGRLLPTSNAARVKFDGAARTVTDGPFTEAKEIIGGYWLWQVRSLDEAIEWLKRAPFEGGDFEIRQVMEMPTP